MLISRVFRRKCNYSCVTLVNLSRIKNVSFNSKTSAYLQQIFVHS
jgi:hypothetical protein